MRSRDRGKGFNISKSAESSKLTKVMEYPEAINTNSKERFNTAAKGGIPDRVPVVHYALGASKSILDDLGWTWGDIFWDREKSLKAVLRARELLPHDNVCSLLSPVCGIDALGVDVLFSEIEGPHIDYKKPFLSSWDDLERLEVPDPEKDGTMPLRIGLAELLSKNFGKELALLGGFGGISTWAMQLRGARNFVLDTKKNPDFQTRYMEFLTECAIEFCVAQVEAGCDWIISAEDAFAIEVLDPERAWKVNGVHAKRLASAVHKAGAGYIAHCCGNAKFSLDKMADTGADMLSLDKVDLAETKEKIGSRVALMGNIKLRTLMYGSPNDVEAECSDAIAKASKGGGYLLSSGYIMAVATPLKNVAALIQSAEKYGRY